MGLYRSPDIHWCHGQEYELEDLVKRLENCDNKLLLKFDLVTYFLTRPYPYFKLSEILSM